MSWRRCAVALAATVHGDVDWCCEYWAAFAADVQDCSCVWTKHSSCYRWRDQLILELNRCHMLRTAHLGLSSEVCIALRRGFSIELYLWYCKPGRTWKHNRIYNLQLLCLSQHYTVNKKLLEMSGKLSGGYERATCCAHVLPASTICLALLLVLGMHLRISSPE